MMRNALLLGARVVVGSYLAVHGSQKLFGAFGGPGLDKAAAGFERIGLAPGRQMAALAGVTELGGGLLTIAGAADPAGPLAIMGAMTVASATHRANGPMASKGGFELPLTNLAAAAALVAAGPGRLRTGPELPRSVTVLAATVGAVLAAGSLAKMSGATRPADAAQASALRFSDGDRTRAAAMTTGAPAGHELGHASDLPELLQRWRDDLAAWAIPETISAAVTESPWVLPRQVFARRADTVSEQPQGPSYERAWAALDPPGTVLDIGSGPGAACLPLIPRTTGLTAVDADEAMLTLLAERAAARGTTATCVTGRWPQVASEVPVADLVTCHHVLYNVPDLDQFIVALTEHARRLVVAEITATHPLTSLNPLWLKFHELERPDRPTGADVLAIMRALGLAVQSSQWQRAGGADYASFAELVDVTRRRLCLSPARADEVADTLVEAGVDPAHPQDLGSSGRDVLTIWWNGSARN